MRIGICPGSFDPVTKGHIDVFERGSKLVDKLIVAVFSNPTKKPLFTMEEREDMLRETTRHISNIEVASAEGLLNEYAIDHGATVIIRGLRALSDFEYEFQRALLMKKSNRALKRFLSWPIRPIRMSALQVSVNLLVLVVRPAVSYQTMWKNG